MINILDIVMQDAGITIREWFSEAMVELIKEGECFSGKRPLGDSGWWWDMMDSIMATGIANDENKAQQMLLDAINQLMGI